MGVIGTIFGFLQYDLVIMGSSLVQVRVCSSSILLLPTQLQVDMRDKWQFMQ